MSALLTSAIESVSVERGPVCLFENPSRLENLNDMLVLRAEQYVRMMDALRTLEEKSRQGPVLNFDENEALLAMIDRTCALFQLRSAHKQIATIFAAITNGNNCHRMRFADMLAELRIRLTQDLEDRWFFAVTPEQRELFEHAPTSFGQDVVDAFRSARYDIEESARCLVFERSTACVFHLMRVMEVGLRALGKTLNDPDIDPKRNPAWERILKKCDDELKKANTDRCAEWKANPTFFAEATANLRVVKEAWRNPTMHVEITYDPERAQEIRAAVRTFMKHLATTIRE